MADTSFDDVLHLAEQLSETDQNRLIYQLRLKQTRHKSHGQAADDYEPVRDEWFLKRGSEYVEYYRSPTREELIEELDNLRAAGAFSKAESLYGKYANPTVPEMSEEEFHADLHAIATEWEQELDEFDANDT
jgi:hypothetical protein